jgi:hypothetical protein
MIRTFCDICKDEIKEPNRTKSPNFMRAEGPSELDVNIRFGKYLGNSEWSDDYCKYCVLYAIAKLDDRKATT